VARAPLDPPGRLIDVGTHRLHVHCSGEGGPAVVFDAALGGSSISWMLVHTAVATFTTACSYDRAGFGWSDAGPVPRTAGRIADELYELLVRCAVPPPYVLVGHSFGGLSIRVLAARHPERVAGLVFVDPAHPEDWLEPPDSERARIAKGVRLCRHGEVAARLGLATLVATLVSAGALNMARGVTALVSRGGLRRQDEEILAPVSKLPPDVRPMLKWMWTQPRFYDALGSQIESICSSAAEVPLNPDFGHLPLVTVSPTTLTERRRALQEALANRSPRGRHIVAADSSHWIPLDEPATVIAAVREVVDAVRAGPS
jgi:pimeloyl-ACP methyl ester carboxylesterase